MQTPPSTHQRQHKSRTPRSKALGFALVEVILAVLVLGSIGLYAYRGVSATMMENKADTTGEDMAMAMQRMNKDAQGQGSTPYSGTSAELTAALANTLRERSSVLTVTGSGATATVQHALGGTASQVVVTQGTLTSAGDSAVITASSVSNVACMPYIGKLTQLAQIISINGTVVKQVPAPAVQYSGNTAKNNCTVGDTNTIVVTFR